MPFAGRRRTHSAARSGRPPASWVVVSGLPPDDVRFDLDGIPTTRSGAVAVAPAEHANGVTTIDHIVLLCPDLGRTVELLATVGATPRRRRDGQLDGRPIQQIFFRFADVIVEVVGSAETASDGPSTLWGITYNVADIDATADYFGDRIHAWSSKRCSPDAGSPRCDTTSSECRSARR